jgi:hypothetical protein
MKRSLLLFALLVSGISSYCQVGLSLYPLNNAIGLRTSIERNFSAEGRLSYDLNRGPGFRYYQFHPQLIFTSRIASAPQVDVRVGLGIGYFWKDPEENSVTGTLPVSFQFFPVKDNNHFCIHLEGRFNAQLYSNYLELVFRGVVGASFFINDRRHKEPERRG